MNYFSSVFIGIICGLIGVYLTPSVVSEEGECKSPHICDGVIVNGVNVSLTSFEGLNDTMIDGVAQIQLVELDGTEVHRIRNCLSLCQSHRLTSPNDFCKRISLESYIPIRKSKCYYDNTSYYSVEKGKRASIYKYQPSWTTFYIKNMFCAKDPCVDSESYCDGNFTHGNGTCVCTGGYQGRFCDTWDFKKRLDYFWRFEKSGLHDEIGNVEGGIIGKTVKINRAIQRKSNVLYLRGDSDMFRANIIEDSCLRKRHDLITECTTGFTLMFWIRGMSRGSHERCSDIMNTGNNGNTGLYIDEIGDGNGIFVQFKTTNMEYKCYLQNSIREFYRKWYFFGISYLHAEDKFIAMRNAHPIDTCIKTSTTTTTTIKTSSFVLFTSNGSGKFIDDIMYVEKSSDFEMIQEYYDSTKISTTSNVPAPPRTTTILMPDENSPVLIETKEGSTNILIVPNYQIGSGNIITTIPIMSNDWSLSLEIKLNGLLSKYANIIHFTIGGNCCQYGWRVPAIFVNGNILHITSAINSKGNNYYDFTAIDVGKSYTIKLEQIKKKDGIFQFTAFMNGNQFHTVENNDARRFENVIVYALNPWSITPNGIIKNILFKNRL